MDAPSRAGVAAVATPALFAALLRAAGYPLVPREASDPAVAAGVAVLVYLLPLSALGAGAVLARDRGLVGWPPVAVASLAAAPLFGLPWDAAVVDFGVYAVGGLVAAAAVTAVEYALRHPARARRVVPPRVAAVALGAGAVHAAVVLGVGSRWYTWSPSVPLLGWVLPGLVGLVAVPAVLSLRAGVHLPVVLAATASAYSLWVEATTATPGDPLGIYVVAWPLTLGLALLAGAAEYVVRRRVGGGRPPDRQSAHR